LCIGISFRIKLAVQNKGGRSGCQWKKLGEGNGGPARDWAIECDGSAPIHRKSLLCGLSGWTIGAWGKSRLFTCRHLLPPLDPRVVPMHGGSSASARHADARRVFSIRASCRCTAGVQHPRVAPMHGGCSASARHAEAAKPSRSIWRAMGRRQGGPALLGVLGG
jgi:hypothetical protein